MKKITEDQDKWKIIMFMNWKTPHCCEGAILKPSYRFSEIPYQNLRWDCFVEIELILKIIWKCKSNDPDKEQSWRIHTPWYQNLLKITTKQDIVVLTQGYTYWSVEHNWESGNKSISLWSANFQQRWQDYSIVKE